jgi:hypothetical protein
MDHGISRWTIIHNPPIDLSITRNIHLPGPCLHLHADISLTSMVMNMKWYHLEEHKPWRHHPVQHLELPLPKPKSTTTELLFALPVFVLHQLCKNLTWTIDISKRCHLPSLSTDASLLTMLGPLLANDKLTSRPWKDMSHIPVLVACKLPNICLAVKIM